MVLLQLLLIQFHYLREQLHNNNHRRRKHDLNEVNSHVTVLKCQKVSKVISSTCSYCSSICMSWFLSTVKTMKLIRGRTNSITRTEGQEAQQLLGVADRTAP